MFKNEVLFLYNDNNSKDKSMNDNSSSMRNLTIENDRLKMKLENSNNEDASFESSKKNPLYSNNFKTTVSKNTDV